MKLRYRVEKRILKPSLIVLQIGTDIAQGCCKDTTGKVVKSMTYDRKEVVTLWRDAEEKDLPYLKKLNQGL